MTVGPVTRGNNIKHLETLCEMRCILRVKYYFCSAVQAGRADLTWPPRIPSMRIASLGNTESKTDQSDQVPPKRVRKRRHLRSSPPYGSSSSSTTTSRSSTSSNSRQSASTAQDDVLIPLIDCSAAEAFGQVVSSPMLGPGCNSRTYTTSTLSSTWSSIASSTSSVTNLNHCGSPTGLLQQNSPVDRTHSPGYDLRETTARRRSYQGNNKIYFA